MKLWGILSLPWKYKIRYNIPNIPPGTNPWKFEMDHIEVSYRGNTSMMISRMRKKANNVNSM